MRLNAKTFVQKLIIITFAVMWCGCVCAQEMTAVQAYEAHLASCVQQMLEKVAGMDKVSVSVRADIDVNQSVTSQELLDMNAPVVKSTKRTAAGEEVIYDFSKKTIQQTQNSDVIKGLSVAVLVDDDLSDADKQKLLPLVQAAVGFNAERGDKIEFLLAPFKPVSALWIVNRYLFVFIFIFAAGLSVIAVAKGCRKKQPVAPPAPLPDFARHEVMDELLHDKAPVEKVIRKVLPHEPPEGQTVWEELTHIKPDTLAHYLKGEYPQTVAVILSKIKPDYVADVLALLPESFAMDVVMRLLRLENVNPEMLNGIEDTLRADLVKNGGVDNQERVADIFNKLDKRTENRLMSALFDRNREVAEQLRAAMFTFEDLSELDSSALQMVLRQVDKAKLALALKGTSDVMKNTILQNMSDRERAELMRQMKDLGAVRLSDVDKAQSDVVAFVKDLATGEIVG